MWKFKSLTVQQDLNKYNECVVRTKSQRIFDIVSCPKYNIFGFTSISANNVRLYMDSRASPVQQDLNKYNELRFQQKVKENSVLCLCPVLNITSLVGEIGIVYDDLTAKVNEGDFDGKDVNLEAKEKQFRKCGKFSDFSS